MNLREEGKSAAEIKEILEKEKLQASIYITVDTLKYLKKGISTSVGISRNGRI